MTIYYARFAKRKLRKPGLWDLLLSPLPTLVLVAALGRAMWFAFWNI